MKAVKYIVPILTLILFFGCSSEKLSFVDEMNRVYDEKGEDAVVKFFEEAYSSSKYDYDVVAVDNLGQKLFYAGDEGAIKIFEANRKLNPKAVLPYISLAKLHLSLGEVEKSSAMLDEAQKIDSLDLGLVIARKRRNFVADDFEVPTLLEGKPFKIRPLTVADAELDYDAIIKSINHLKGVLGRSDWPDKKMTLEENRQSLMKHEIEFKLREGFVYAIMNEDESKELGCLYIYPARVDRFDAEVVMWLRQDFHTVDNDLLLFKMVDGWLKDSWKFENVIYPGRNITWTSYFDELNIQDQKYH